MLEATDINGLTEADRLAAERLEAMIERQRDESMRNIRLASVQAEARRKANMLRIDLNR
jgi:hypothetical protein